MRMLSMDERARALMDLDLLSKPERRIFDRIVLGEANKQICYRLKLELGTVKNYTTSILRKLKQRSRTQLVANYWIAQVRRSAGTSNG